jgi:3-hydroxypropanoate dehydrogenase
MGKPLDAAAQDTIFREARTPSVWLDKDVPDDMIRAIYDLMKFGPTSANCCPARFRFVRSKEAKERLGPFMDEGNRAKTMKAPVTAIIAYDLKFYEHLGKLFPHEPTARSWFEGKPEVVKNTAFRNGSLQGAYFMIAARALGLDCGPMSGFNAKGVKEEFFKGEDVEVNFICNLAYGDKSTLFPRNPRFTFDEVCKIL